MRIGNGNLKIVRACGLSELATASPSSTISAS
jgi:hypothetical protein